MEQIDTTPRQGAPAANECPPVAGTTEGRCITFGSDAAAQYAEAGATGNPLPAARKYGQNTRGRASGGKGPRTVFRASTGLIWAYTGKKGRVLRMLATQVGGLTQWDCWPWHTRLGASIHVFREAGLVIETRREGEFRHARYFLRTPGALMIQPDNSGGGE